MNVESGQMSRRTQHHVCHARPGKLRHSFAEQIALAHPASSENQELGKGLINDFIVKGLLFGVQAHCFVKVTTYTLTHFVGLCSQFSGLSSNNKIDPADCSARNTGSGRLSELDRITSLS
jgi:hypothetical protein